MNLLKKSLITAAMISTTTFAMANTAVNQNSVNHSDRTYHQLMTVKNALSAKDDTPVKLKGYIVKAIGDEKYRFKDRTGAITVDIDDDLLKGKSISAKTPVLLIGEVDIDPKKPKKIEIDVTQIQF